VTVTVISNATNARIKGCCDQDARSTADMLASPPPQG